MPITNPSEMGQTSLETAVATLRAIAEYKEEFEHVFGQDPTGLTLVRAIAAYERTLLSFDSPFDHFNPWLGIINRRKFRQILLGTAEHRLFSPDKGIGFNPDPEDGKIHRLRRLHRFKRLEAKPYTKAPHRKLVTNHGLTLC
jgi:Di-haem cytochrome c peroxidase